MVNYLPLDLTLLAFVLHLSGERRAVVLTGRPRDRRARSRALTFYAGLATILIALQSPLDALADKLFWAHMIQHLLLLTVAAPLIVLGHPWMSIWRPLPLRVRRALAQTVVRSRYFAPLRALFGVLSRPAGAWLAFNVNLLFWHLPGPYDLTLRNIDVHVLEHSTFLLFGILFWAQVIGARQASSVLPYLWRISYVAGAMLTNVGLSIYLAFAQHALYSPYAMLANRPGGISALADQQIGAGIMWTAGDMPFAIAIALLVHRWLTEQERSTLRLVAPVAGPAERERVPAGSPPVELESR
jgi:cytochrome c oxidase assembly factor CtaG